MTRTRRLGPASAPTFGSGTTGPIPARALRLHLGLPRLHGVLQGPDPTTPTARGRRLPGPEDHRDHRVPPASVVGRREPANRAAEESTLHESAALRRRVLLHVRLSLPEDHPHLEQPALGSQPTSLFQARTLRSLPRRPAPRNGPEAGQPALAWPDPGAAVLPATPAVPGDRGEPKWER